VTINLVVDPQRHTNLLPGNQHQYGPNNQVQGAEMLRVAMTVIVPAQPSPARTDLEHSIILDEHHRPGPYGLALLESQEMSIMLLTNPAEIQAFRAGSPLTFGQNPVYNRWPATRTWEDIIPASTWFPGGTGILSEFDGVDGATVTLYEFAVDQGQAWNSYGEPTGKMVNMVSWHCNRCHSPYDFELDERWENQGPDMRRWASTRARAHARGKDGKCTPPTGEMERVVARVASEIHGHKVELPSPESACAAGEGCSRVRHARAVTARLLGSSPR